MKSQKDICFGVEKTLCVILLVKGDGLDKESVDTFKELNKEFQNKIKRGVAFNFMWLDLEAEP